MDEDYTYGEHCSRCGGKPAFKQWLEDQGRRIVTFLCALCLSLAVGTSELGFLKMAKADQALNAFPTNAVQSIFSDTSLTVTPSGVFMMDFANIQKVEHPKQIQILKESTNTRNPRE